MSSDTQLTTVYIVLCISKTGEETTHIFSTLEKALAFGERDDRGHVFYDYVLDHPERSETALQ